MLGRAVLCLECSINSLLNLHKICSSLRGLVLPGFSRSIILSAYVDDLIVLLRTRVTQIFELKL